MVVRPFIAMITLALLGASGMAYAQVMESTNYQIQSDSINFGGGRGSSTAYRLEDTLGEIGSGDSDSTSYRLRAGYQQMHEVYLALSAPADVVMSPALGGITGGESTGQTSVTAVTDGTAGYRLSVKASSSPAMVGISTLATISDYAPGATPSFGFSVASGETALAYSPEGVDVVARFRDNGATCATGSSETTDACWDGLTQSDVTIVERASPNHPSGSVTDLKFKVGVGANAMVPEDTYVATTTITMIAL
mgnify:FL=1